MQLGDNCRQGRRAPPGYTRIGLLLFLFSTNRLESSIEDGGFSGGTLGRLGLKQRLAELQPARRLARHLACVTVGSGGAPREDAGGCPHPAIQTRLLRVAGTGLLLDPFARPLNIATEPDTLSNMVG
jgi:hypothetical protein